MPDFDEVVTDPNDRALVQEQQKQRSATRKAIVDVDADNFRDRLEHLADLYEVLGVAWLGDPFAAIANLKNRAAKNAAALPARQLFDSIPLFGYELVTRERIRQITQERFTEAHDDEHTDGELAIVGAIYAVAGLEGISVRRLLPQDSEMHARYIDAWPNSWDQEWDKREQFDQLRCLSIAGALICAEIDRLQRLADRNERDERARLRTENDPRAEL